MFFCEKSEDMQDLVQGSEIAGRVNLLFSNVFSRFGISPVGTIAFKIKHSRTFLGCFFCVIKLISITIPITKL